jgi:predicted acetyltransferase
VLADIRWMTRVVDAPRAVTARGFPVGLEVEVPLRLRDPVATRNDGSFVLSVQKGQGELLRCESSAPDRAAAGPELGIGAFASLYTGWATSADLTRAGLLEGGTGAACAALDAAFAGPTPCLLDEF